MLGCMTHIWCSSLQNIIFCHKIPIVKWWICGCIGVDSSQNIWSNNNSHLSQIYCAALHVRADSKTCIHEVRLDVRFECSFVSRPHWCSVVNVELCVEMTVRTVLLYICFINKGQCMSCKPQKLHSKSLPKHPSFCCYCRALESWWLKWKHYIFCGCFRNTFSDGNVHARLTFSLFLISIILFLSIFILMLSVIYFKTLPWYWSAEDTFPRSPLSLCFINFIS